MTDFQDLYDRADAAGREAVNQLVAANKVVPMVVGSETELFSGELDYSKPTYYIEDGVCGFSWLSIKPGNSRFANWLKKNNIARRDYYNGGVTIWVSAYNQSMQKKEAYADAFAGVLRNEGIRAYAQSRMD